MSRQSVIETERLILRPFTPDDAADRQSQNVDSLRPSTKQSVCAKKHRRFCIYQGNKIDHAAFDVTIPADGDYVISVKGTHAAGSMEITFLTTLLQPPII